MAKSAGSVCAGLFLVFSTGFTHATKAESRLRPIAKTPPLELRTASIQYIANTPFKIAN